MAMSVAAATPAIAQLRDPVGGLAIDARALTVSLPATAGWTPTALDAGSIVPGRGWGGEAGAHIVFGPGRHRRLGLGASALWAQGRSTGSEGAAQVTTRLTAVAPHVSWNFGHRLGWSYLSGGAGLARVASEIDGGAPDPSGWGTVFHYGGGARWFVSQHVAVSLDLRFWALTPRGAIGDRPGGPANTRVAFGAGLSVR
ncbi:MAG: outer membrane beta-barrel protein [Vicinamibacterales bacterium]